MYKSNGDTYTTVILGGEKFVSAQEQFRSLVLVHTLSSMIQVLIVIGMHYKEKFQNTIQANELSV